MGAIPARPPPIKRLPARSQYEPTLSSLPTTDKKLVGYRLARRPELDYSGKVLLRGLSQRSGSEDHHEEGRIEGRPRDHRRRIELLAALQCEEGDDASGK